MDTTMGHNISHLIIEQSFDPENIHLSSGDMHKHVSDSLWPDSTFISSSSGHVHYRERTLHSQESKTPYNTVYDLRFEWLDLKNILHAQQCSFVSFLASPTVNINNN